ncbi:acyl-CoA thioester hydrolase [Glaciecola pallidula DSM 14239 = ACAM 615]|jgi:acyl-CoA thioester hydrolase|uniref:Acyl-CoA thioester hydrolase n=1 Tax=Brumicola pallidula DSM 14239 = ACAM 615 TaxID=1121922 RepID=K6ZN82_9ALTE|nr:acyl-CoA thioester hydrolase [Glaciecola pallidula DSM 14239 = ACAM 615]
MNTYCTVNRVNLGIGLQIFVQKQEVKLNKPAQQILNVNDERISALAWQRNLPFVNTWHIQQEHIDHYQHVNNVAYVSQLETLAWQHSNYLGLSMQEYKNLDRGMVIQQHVLNYQRPSHLHDEIACATWIVACDNKCRLSREFQFISTRTQKTVFTAQTHFVCVSLTTGSPKKMPREFVGIYGDAASAHQLG